MFDDSVQQPLVRPINIDFVGPPTYLAVITIGLGVLSVGMAAVTHGAAGWGGYLVGFVGVLAGITFRWVQRARQIEPMFVPNHVVGRMMLLGVLVSFGGIIWNAFHVAQRTIS